MSVSKPHLRYKAQTNRERTLTIHLISLEKTVKAIVLLIVGLKLLTLVNTDVHAWVLDFVTRHGIDVGNRFVQAALRRLVGVTNGQIVTYGVVAIVYSAVLLVEASGLWLQKRWAEYLTAISTALLIPLEVYEIYERFTWVRIAILAINLFIVWYLATRLRDEKKERVVNLAFKSLKPSPPRVKICGITNLEDAMVAIEAGADELGFNFYEKSPRYISPDEARKIVEDLPGTVIKIGVFVNEDMERILEIADKVRLDAIQLHGNESHKFVSQLRGSTKKEIIKAVRSDEGLDLGDIIDFDAHAIMVDSSSEGKFGGTGQLADWDFAKGVWTTPVAVYLAGGLSDTNVAEAVRYVTPYAVDACSRLESSPGKKDPTKVAAFIKAAKEAI
jgi:phosphoribosylanthranilate isomerase